MPRTPAHASRTGDAAVIDLMRLSGTVGIAELSESLGVTATAVRLRLERLVRDGLVERVPSGSPGGRGRGRPANGYRLTSQGRLTGGDNFHDLAMALWDEVRGIRDPSIRRGLLGRIGRRLADQVADAVSEETPQGRLEQVAGLLRQRAVSCSVSTDPAGLSVLTSHSCPYPELADRDRGICAAEREMLEQLTGASVRLTECRLDGDACCRFTATPAAEPVRSAPDGPNGPDRPGRAPRLASEGDSTSNSARALNSGGPLNSGGAVSAIDPIRPHAAGREEALKSALTAARLPPQHPRTERNSR